MTDLALQTAMQAEDIVTIRQPRAQPGTQGSAPQRQQPGLWLQQAAQEQAATDEQTIRAAPDQIHVPEPPARVQEHAPVRVKHHPVLAPLDTWVDAPEVPLRPARLPRSYWDTPKGDKTLQMALWGILRHNARKGENDRRHAAGLRHVPKSEPVWVRLSTVMAQFDFNNVDNPSPEEVLKCADEAVNDNNGWEGNRTARYLHYWQLQDNGEQVHWLAANPAIY